MCRAYGWRASCPAGGVTDIGVGTSAWFALINQRAKEIIATSKGPPNVHKLIKSICFTDDKKEIETAHPEIKRMVKISLSNLCFFARALVIKIEVKTAIMLKGDKTKTGKSSTPETDQPCNPSYVEGANTLTGKSHENGKYIRMGKQSVSWAIGDTTSIATRKPRPKLMRVSILANVIGEPRL
ncbi:MAG: hypothetical protein QM715_01290 [Nibricoccus sp.]